MNDSDLKSQQNPWEMKFDDFSEEYKTTLVNVAKKQDKGGLDSSTSNYKDISVSEFEVLKKDWKQFSKMRGFNEEDIKEYDRWLVISGRRDFEDALWLYEGIGSNGLNDHIKCLYLKFIELAKSRNIEINPLMVSDYESVKKEIYK